MCTPNIFRLETVGNHARRLLLAAACLMLASTAGYAALEGHDARQPIEITADSLNLLEKGKSARFNGNVIAKQGEMTLTADEMTVRREEDNGKTGENPISQLEVKGNAHLSTPQESIRGDWGVYDVNRGLVKIHGHVELRRGQNLLRGTVLTYNLRTGKSEITGDGNPDNGRIKGFFVPSTVEEKTP